MSFERTADFEGYARSLELFHRIPVIYSSVVEIESNGRVDYDSVPSTALAYTMPTDVFR